MANLLFFHAAFGADEFEVKARWAQIEAGSELRLVSAYRAVLDAPGGYDPDVVWKLGRLLEHTGHPTEALRLSEHLVDHYRASGDREGLAGALCNQALVLSGRGDWDGAMALHREEERLCREMGQKDGLSVALGRQALILRDWGDLEGALALHREEERLCREMGNKELLARVLTNEAVILGLIRKQPAQALALADEAYRLGRGG